jgi:hypothetical protein
VAPAVVGVMGLAGEKLEALHAGAGELAPLTLHVRLTGDLYPLYAVNVIVDVVDVPGDTAAGVDAPMANAGP